MVRRAWMVIASAILLAGSAGATQAPVLAEPIARGGVVDWALFIPYQQAVLTVSTPDGEVARSELGPGSSPTFSSLDETGEARPEGSYNWELRLEPILAPDVERRLAAALARGDQRAVREIQRAQGLERELVESGTLVLSGGAFVTDEATEPDPRAPAAKLGSVSGIDEVIDEDLIVRGSTCVGAACFDGMSFTLAPLVVSSTLPNLMFDDTSSRSAHDWAFLVNGFLDSSNAFSLAEITSLGVRSPFTISGGAGNHALFVDGQGRVGLGTSTPAARLHIDSVSPAVRLEWHHPTHPGQTWEVRVGPSFHIGDITAGRFPFSIARGAPSNSMFIRDSGNVGLGTSMPQAALHVYHNTDANMLVSAENPHPGPAALGGLRSKSDVATASFQSHGSGRTLSRFGRVLGGWNEMLAATGNGLILGTLASTPLILGTNGTSRMQIGATGDVTVTGNFTVTGGTKNFAVVDPDDGSRAIYFAALEGPEAGTYVRGAGRTQGGEAVIVLPGYFAKVTEAEGVTVQLTPVGAWSRLYVAEQGAGRLVVRVADGDPDVAFNYQVQGVRKGYRDFAVERPNTLDP